MIKKFILIFILLVSCTNTQIQVSHDIQLKIKRIDIGSFNALKFPSNGDAPVDTFIAIKYDNPQNDGLPIWGPDKQGTSFIWEYYPIQQKGYYVTFWWANNGAFQWMDGNTNSYYGCHPYPLGGPPGGETTEHEWELAGMKSGADNIKTLSDSPLLVEKGRWFVQAFRVKVNDDGTKTGRFYIDLPDTSENKIIEVTADENWGEVLPPSPAFIFGDAPWGPIYYGTERLSGLLGRVKIFNKALPLQDLKSEALEMNRLVTLAGENNIWWGKTSYKTVDDLICDYGTKREFSWVNPDFKARMAEVQDDRLSKTIVLEPVYENEISKIQLPLFNHGPNSLIKDIRLLKNDRFNIRFRDLPYKVTDGDSILLKISFSPDTAGIFSDTLLIFTSSHRKPFKLYLSGTSLPVSARTSEADRDPGSYSIKYKYENNFQTLGSLNYVLHKATHVVLSIYNFSGDKIKNLVDEKAPEGHYSIKWDGTNNENVTVGSGIYFAYRILGNKKEVSKFALFH